MSEDYLVFTRKWRPQNFDQILGQDQVVIPIKRAIEINRVMQAYLFSGPRGVGKTTIARVLAKAVNCEKGPTLDPCNTCDICKEITAGNSLDVIEIDGASNNGVESIRELREQVGFAAAKGRKKIYIIDEVHMLSTSAFNALLKTLEEPPSHVIFVFATTDPQNIPQTILSRCQHFRFKRSHYYS
jgi:DNA polymerase-3 subunit gamma/tau